MEQREIKVSLVRLHSVISAELPHCSTDTSSFLLVSFLCSAYSKSLLRHFLWFFVFRLSSIFFSRLPFLVFSVPLTMPQVLFQCFLLTLSSLPSLLGVTCPSLLSSSPSLLLLLHPFFLLFSAVYFPGEYSAHGVRLLCCPTVHVCSPTP